MDAVSDRDFCLEFLSFAAITMNHLSRLSSELILWSSEEFSYVELPDEFCTGSSMMPNKKNPDILELIRGRSLKIVGYFTHIAGMLHSLPLTYNRDMQEDKEPVFNSVDLLYKSIVILNEILKGIKVNRERLLESIDGSFICATDLADYLVGKGIAFRDAHYIVGRIVRYAISKGKKLREISIREMKRFSESIEEDVYEWIKPETSILKKNRDGGTSVDGVRSQIREGRNFLRMYFKK